MKGKKLIPVLVMACFCTLGFTACKEQTPPHEHSWSTEWTKDADVHYHAPECDDTAERKDEAPHVYDDDRDATCNVCGYVREIAKQVTGLTVRNKEDVENWIGSADKTLDIELTGDYTLEEARAEGVLKIASEDNEKIVVNGLTLHAAGAGECKITVTAGSFKEEINIVVRIANITVSSSVLNGHADGRGLAFSVTAKGADGSDLDFTVTDENDPDAYYKDGKFYSSLYTGAAHKIKITAHDDASGEDVSATVTANLYRQITLWEDGASVKRESTWTWNTDAQEYGIQNTGNAVSAFNMAKSEKFFAQASYKLSDIDQIRYAGFMYSTGDTASKPDMLSVVRKTENGYALLVKELGSSQWSFNVGEETLNIPIPEEALEDGKCLLQVARSGADYYFFVNGTYLGMLSSQSYGTGVATRPGFYMHGGGSNIQIRVNTVQFYTGDEADDFIEEHGPAVVISIGGTAGSGEADGVKQLNLPTVKIADTRGNPVDVEYTLTDLDDPNAVIANGKISSRVYTGAAHTVRVSATVDGKEYTADFKVNFYRQTTLWNGDGVSRESTWTYQTDDQVIGLKNAGNLVSAFNMEKSEKYFAQVNYKLSDLDQVRYAGIMSTTGDTSSAPGQWLWSVVKKVDDGYVLLVKEQAGTGWSFDEAGATLNIPIPVEALADGYCLLQVARDGADYYFFVNGTYLGVLHSQYYGEGVATRAGYYMHGGSYTGMLKVNKVQYYTGDEVDGFIEENVPATAD